MKKSPPVVILALIQPKGEWDGVHRYVGMSRNVFRSVRRSMQRRDAGRWDGKVARA